MSVVCLLKCVVQYGHLDSWSGTECLDNGEFLYPSLNSQSFTAKIRQIPMSPIKSPFPIQ